MIDKSNVQHNLKTGSESDIIFIREVTDNNADLGKLLVKSGIYRFPYLTRRTGSSIKGTTDAIESNELRKNRAKSKKRLGNESSEGSLDIELSPTTFDDNIAAAMRGEWKRWVSDSKVFDIGSDTPRASAINLDNTACQDGFFITRCTGNEKEYNTDEKFGLRRLLNVGGATTDGLINVPAGVVVHELTCGKKDIKYSLLEKLGGAAGEDLYKEYKHMAVNTMSVDVQIGAIVTGSFGFMGSNNPKRMDEEAARANFGGSSGTRFKDGASTGNDFIDSMPEKSTDTDQFTSREGDLWINGKNITFATSLSMELNNGLEKKYAIFVKPAISVTPLQLDITGELRTYAIAGEEDLYNAAIENSTNEIVFAFMDKETDPEFIYVFQIFKSAFESPDSSANGADTYEDSYQYSSFEERNVRIFRIALPKAREIAFEADPTDWTKAGKISVLPNVEVEAGDIIGLTVKDVLKNADGAEIATQKLSLVSKGQWIADTDYSVGDIVIYGGKSYYCTKANTAAEFPEDNFEQFIRDDLSVVLPEAAFAATDGAEFREIEVTLNGTALSKSFGVTEKEAPSAVTDLTVTPANKGFTATWKDSDSADLDHIEVDVIADGESVRSATVEKGRQSYTASRLTNGTEYTVSVAAVDGNGNRSAAETATVTPAAD